MKIGGVTVTKCEEVLVLPRLDGDLVFKAQAVSSMEEFQALCPKPKPPVSLVKGGKKENTSAPSYLQDLKIWSERRFAFICIVSLQPSEIEWDTVDLEKANTWTNWMDDLTNAGMADVEVQRIQQLVLDANSLNEQKLKAAREAFLLGQGANSEESSGLPTEPASTQSGVPASDSE